jgi:hypothetical protein
MPRFSRNPLNKLISLRVTEEDNQLLEDLGRALKLPGGKADVLRRALDFWLENAPEAQQAGKQTGRKKDGG